MNHRIEIGKAQDLSHINAESVELVVTSPPYPMIGMWDDILARQNPEIKVALDSNKGALAFELMHQELDRVWVDLMRVITPGGYVCINIGDATRTLSGDFSLYPNHSRIISAFLKLGFTILPGILWRKQTNAPNKFMGAGMLPSGAYVTLEHEWILIFRKGTKRQFKTDAEKHTRKQSAFFWEERNTWFSDLWDFKGVRQRVKSSTTRERSGAFPFEIPYRLINMFSLKGDTVLDPFLGTGTTMLAAMVLGRNSLGVEIDESFLSIISAAIADTPIDDLNNVIYARLHQHKDFIRSRATALPRNEIKHFNVSLNVPVITSHETGIKMSVLKEIEMVSNREYLTKYEDIDLSKKEADSRAHEQLSFV